MTKRTIQIVEETTPVMPEEISPAPEIDTTDWKTYRNEKYGFEVKYPKDWEFFETDYPKELETYAFGIGFVPEEVGCREEWCYIWPVEIIVWKSFPTAIHGGKVEVNYILGGLPAIKSKGYMELEEVFTIEKPNKYDYYFELINHSRIIDGSFDEIVESISNGIISTFAFIE